MAGSVQRQKVYVPVTELCLLAKALRAASIPPESPAKTRQIDPRFTKRMVKKQQMRWSPRGAHSRSAPRVLNDSTTTLADDYRCWYPGFTHTDGRTRRMASHGLSRSLSTNPSREHSWVPTRSLLDDRGGGDHRRGEPTLTAISDIAAALAVLRAVSAMPRYGLALIAGGRRLPSAPAPRATCGAGVAAGALVSARSRRRRCRCGG